MSIKSLELTGFKRTALNGIKNIKVQFNDPMQVILGTNGCGKTCFVAQTLAWVPDPEDFLTGGGRRAVYEKDNIVFEMVSVKKTGFKHEFWRDGVNLNPGGTGGVQKELCTRYFGITQDVYNVLTGRTIFTKLPTSKRRELFTYLSPTDLSYALSVFNRVKAQARANINILKHSENRITQESAKILDDAQAAVLEASADQLRGEIELILRQTNQTKRSNFGQANDLLQKLLGDAAGMVGMVDQLSHWDSPESFQENLRTLREHVQTVKATRGAKLNEFAENERILIEMRNQGEVSKDKLEEFAKDLTTKLTLIPQDVRFIESEQTKTSYEEAEMLESSIVFELQALAGVLTEEFDFSDTAYGKLRNDIGESEDLLSRYRKVVRKLEDRQAHLQHSPEADCPQCKHRFTFGAQRGEPEQLVERIAKGRASIELEESRHNSLKSLEKGFAEYLVHRNNLSQIANNYPRLRPFFDALIETGYPQKVSHDCVTLFMNWKESLRNAYRRWELQHELTKVNEQLERLRNTDLGQLDNICSRSESLKNEIELLTRDLEASAKELTRLEALEKQLGHLNQLTDRIEKGAQVVSDEFAKEIDVIRNHWLEFVLREHQNQLASIVSRLNQRSVAKALIADLENQVTECRLKEKAYNKLISTLNPSDGLIAEQLTGFIASFIGNMNTVLEKVWSYHLKIRPCGIEDGDLNYYFPLEVVDEVSNDVNDGSLAQREVVDFAFVLTLALRIDPETIPLIMDELGAHFDETHRQVVMQFVRDYVDAGKAKLAFLISHYAANHAAFTSAEILVFDASNILVPRTHNKHVEFS